jgi:hypothetical protein
LTADLVTNRKDTLKGYQVSYDASKDVFEIKLSSEVKLLDQKKIAGLILPNMTFVSRDDGFYQELSPGSYSLLKKYKAIIQRSNYNPALNSGSKYDQWDHKSEYFILHKGIVNKVKLNKRSVLKILGLTETQLQEDQKLWVNIGSEDTFTLFFNSINKK